MVLYMMVLDVRRYRNIIVWIHISIGMVMNVSVWMVTMMLMVNALNVLHIHIGMVYVVRWNMAIPSHILCPIDLYTTYVSIFHKAVEFFFIFFFPF